MKAKEKVKDKTKKPNKEKEKKEVKEKPSEKIVKRNQVMDLSLAEVKDLGKIFAESGMFNDARTAAQAVVKIMSGKELGIAPITSMSKIYMVEGKITLSAEVMAGLIKKSGDYDYVVKQLDNEICKLEFHKFQEGKWNLIGVSNFSFEDARKVTNKAGKSLVAGANWRNYPRNMLFARALSNGARWYCAHLIHGVYHYDEMGLNVDGDDQVINVTPAEQKKEPEKPKVENKPVAEKVEGPIRKDLQDEISMLTKKLGAKTTADALVIAGVKSIDDSSLELLKSIRERLRDEVDKKNGAEKKVEEPIENTTLSFDGNDRDDKKDIDDQDDIFKGKDKEEK